MVLEILVICLIVEFLLALVIFQFDLLAPAVVFDAVFVVASLDLFLMKDFWQVDIQWITFFVITVGTGVFTLTTYIIENSKVSFRRIYLLKIKYTNDFVVSNFYLNAFIIVYFSFILCTMIYVINSSGFGVTLSTLFSNYLKSIEAGERLNLPFFLSIFSILCSSAGYIWGYLFANNWVKTGKINLRLLLLVGLTCIIGISTGKRGDMVAIIASIAIILIMLLKQNYSKRVSRKIYFTIGIMMALVILSFQKIATVMGRDSYLFSPLEYISIYIGAPILNLNTSILQGKFNHPVFLSETLHSLYSSIGENLSIDEFIYNTDRVFWASPNGKRVGNVATIFYDFYHDGGLVGVILLSMFMALIMQLIYKGLKEEKYKNKTFFSIVYSYMLWLVARSFFANSLYDWITLSTIYTLILWWVYSVILPRLRRVR